jgi:asparagine synthetase B (glutamine-hydrolysing)
MNGQRFVALSCYVYVDHLKEVLGKPALEQIGSYVPSLSSDGGNGAKGAAGGGEFADSTISFALPGDYLRKIDVMSSAHGLEVRVPFLGEQVLACSAQLPEHLKYSRQQNKIILRRLAEKYLPKAIAEKRKGGFGIPLDTWLGRRGREEIHGMLSSPAARIAPLIARSHLDTLLPEFAGRRPDLSRRSRFSTYQQVYCLWALELWLNQWNPIL